MHARRLLRTLKTHMDYSCKSTRSNSRCGKSTVTIEPVLSFSTLGLFQKHAARVEIGCHPKALDTSHEEEFKVQEK